MLGHTSGFMLSVCRSSFQDFATEVAWEFFFFGMFREHVLYSVGPMLGPVPAKVAAIERSLSHLIAIFHYSLFNKHVFQHT